MRYYDLRLFDPKTGDLVREWTTHPGGVFDPHALLLEFDVLTALQNAPHGQSTLTLHGVPLQDLSQSIRWGFYSDSKGKTHPGYSFSLRAGMQAGLPLANPKQAGLILSGQVFQSWGNWEGTEQTVDLLVTSGGWSSLSDPAPIALNWPAGTELSQALQPCLQFAYPDSPVQIHLGTGLTQAHDEYAIFSTLDQLAQWIYQLTQARFLSPVRMAFNGLTILVFDSSYQPATIRLDFTDFVGQPTWIQPQTMQVKLVMRADLTLGGLIELPKGMQDNPGIVLAAASALPSSIRYQSTFKGTFRITGLRHVGNSRSSDGASWVTIVNCTPNA